MTNSDSTDETIGYKRPPSRSRFAKGKSGNPKGRPKGARSAATLASVVNQTVSVTVEGVTQKMPLTDALAMSLAQRALAGNTAAAREFMKIADKVAEQQKLEEANQPIGEFRLVAFVTEDWLEPLRRLGIFEELNGDTYVCRWVVEAALARDPSIKIDDEERRLVLHVADRQRRRLDTSG